MDILAVQGLSHRYAGIEALREISFGVPAGQLLGIIGPNGAGKTTLLNCLTGTPPPTGGTVTFDGRDITRMPVHRRAQMGIARSFQVVSLLNGLTVWENAMLAVSGARAMRYRPFRPLRSYTEASEAADALLASVQLGGVPDVPVTDLSYGEQRRLDFALTLATKPKLLLLDEPGAGLSESEGAELAALVRSLGQSVTVVIIDHDIDLVFGLVERVLVLHQGALLADGPPATIGADERVREVYLGGGSRVA